MGTTRQRMNLGVSGTQTAGLGVGGMIPSTVYSAVEEYNGSIWTAGTSLPVATQQSGGAGPETSYMMLGTPSDRSEGLSYNGSAWSAEGSSSEGFAYGALAGQETAALAFYGATRYSKRNRKEYNGTAWTTIVPSLPNQGNSGGAGGTTSAAVFSGAGTTARYWNGTTVAATTSMATPRANYGSIGGPPGIFVAAGGNGDVSATEEFSFSIYSPIAATWASGGNLNTAVNLGTTFGTQTATVQTGGGPPFTGATEEYDGSTWTTSPGSLNTPRGQVLASSGVLTAGLAFGGGTPSDSNATEEYDGSTWTTTGNMNLGRRYISGFGIQTATIAAGGFTSPPAANRNNSEEYNGSTWTAGPTINNARNGLSGTGTTSAGLIFAGSPQTLNGGFTEEWNGTAWSEQNDMSVKRSQVGRVAGGNQNPPYSARIMTSWSESMTTARATSGDGTATRLQNNNNELIMIQNKYITINKED
jgi:hypothetical protein